MIWEATATMLLELATSFFEKGSGFALAEAVIHNINKKPVKQECHQFFANINVSYFYVTVNGKEISILFLLLNEHILGSFTRKRSS